MTSNKEIIQFRNEGDVMAVISKQYAKAIENFFGDPKLALEFGSNVRTALQRNPALIGCTPESLLNSFMTMASLKLMPSGVSGEAFVLPYNIKGTMVAQFQLGYQGLVTLFYRAGAKSIVAEIVHAGDRFNILNGEISHVYDPFAESRGEAIGAHVIVELATGGKVQKAMSKKEILEIAKKFSKTYGKDFSPWNEKSDPERWMWKKTVLKQAAKLVPKNPELNQAIAEDNKDSVIGDRPEAPKAIPATTDWSELEEKLISIQNLDELMRCYADLVPEAKLALKGIYEGQKAILEQEAKDSIS